MRRGTWIRLLVAALASFVVVASGDAAFAQGMGATQTLTVGGVGMSAERVLDLRALLEEARHELKKLQGLKAKGGRCGAVKERAELVGDKVDVKLERALMLLAQQNGAATVNVHMNVQDTPPQGQVLAIAPPAPVEEEPPLMTPAEVSRLTGAVGSEAFADDKLRVLQLGTSSGLWMRASDVITVLGGFQFGDDKLKALQLMAGHIYDRENAFQILKSFTFSEEKERAQQILR